MVRWAGQKRKVSDAERSRRIKAALALQSPAERKKRAEKAGVEARKKVAKVKWKTWGAAGGQKRFGSMAKGALRKVSGKGGERTAQKYSRKEIGQRISKGIQAAAVKRQILFERKRRQYETSLIRFTIMNNIQTRVYSAIESAFVEERLQRNGTQHAAVESAQHKISSLLPAIALPEGQKIRNIINWIRSTQRALELTDEEMIEAYNKGNPWAQAQKQS